MSSIINYVIEFIIIVFCISSIINQEGMISTLKLIQKVDSMKLD